MDTSISKSIKDIFTKALNDTLRLSINNQLVSPKKFLSLIENYERQVKPFIVEEIQYTYEPDSSLKFKVACNYNDRLFIGTFNITPLLTSFNNSGDVQVKEYYVEKHKKEFEILNKKEKRINKQAAMNIVNNYLCHKVLNRTNTHIANISKSRPSWWLNIPPNRFLNDLHLILVKKNSFFWVKIPAPFYSSPSDHFSMREDKNVVDIIISSEKGDDYMHDIRNKYYNFDFKGFIQHEFNF
ncbi:MAG: hypothetical protein ACSHXF_16145 [Aquaticitalea sp.]